MNSRATHLKFVCPHRVTLRPQLPDTELLSKRQHILSFQDGSYNDCKMVRIMTI